MCFQVMMFLRYFSATTSSVFCFLFFFKVQSKIGMRIIHRRASYTGKIESLSVTSRCHDTKIFSSKQTQDVNVKVEQDIIKEVSALTTGQRDNPAWHLARKGRITASNFGAVLKAKRVTQVLTTRLLGDYDLSRVRAIAWGVDTKKWQ